MNEADVRPADPPHANLQEAKRRLSQRAI